MAVSLVPLLASLFIFGAIVLVGLLVQRYRLASSHRRSLALVEGYASANPHEAIVRVELEEKSLIRVGLMNLGNRLVSEDKRAELAKSAIRAGDQNPLAADAIVMRKVVYLLVGLLLGLLLGLARGGLWWAAVPVLSLAGFYVPNLLVYNRAIKRDEQMGRELPDALDMLNLCVESGLSFQAAMGKVAENQQGAVADEFAIALQEMQLGRSRGEAMAAMAERTRQPDIERFVSAMLQVDKLGVPVAVVLREQAKEMRAKRFARAREQAQKVPVKILMPLMLCFLPALFIIILGPAAFSIADVFSGIGG